MYGGFGGRANRGLVIGVVGLFAATPALSADLGGDCCADLEERVAELEATTARKGNRKVSLTVSGWVSEAVFWWDDGTEQNVYVGTNSLEQDRFRFTGEAKIDKTWSAGYTLEVGIFGEDSKSWNQASPAAANSTTLIVRKSNWWIKSKDLGRLLVGLDGSSTYHLLDDADSTQTRNVDDAEAGAVALGAFQLRRGGAPVAPAGTALKWTDILRGFNNSTSGQDGRRNIVKYDSPAFAGFTVSASWGVDDLWDAALIYKNDIGDFSVAGRAGYGESTDEVATKCGGSPADFRCRWWGAAAAIQHKPTGVYVYGGWGQQSIDNATLPAGLETNSTTWIIQPGIEPKWFPLGKTTIYGEYRHDDAGASLSATNGITSRGADINFWAGGAVQGIEAADMIIYAVYRHTDGDFKLGTAGALGAAGTKVDLDAFDMVITGAKINF